MHKTWKRKWIKALRSGDYKQGKEALCRISSRGNHSFCCLGVLCDILPARMVDWDHRALRDADNVHVYWVKDNDGDSEMGWLPRSVREECGITLDQQKELAAMNDKGEKFSTIADWVEENL